MATASAPNAPPTNTSSPAARVMTSLASPSPSSSPSSSPSPVPSLNPTDAAPPFATSTPSPTLPIPLGAIIGIAAGGLVLLLLLVLGLALYCIRRRRRLAASKKSYTTRGARMSELPGEWRGDRRTAGGGRRGRSGSTGGWMGPLGLGGSGGNKGARMGYAVHVRGNATPIPPLTPPRGGFARPYRGEEEGGGREKAAEVEMELEMGAGKAGWESDGRSGHSGHM